MHLYSMFICLKTTHSCCSQKLNIPYCEVRAVIYLSCTSHIAAQVGFISKTQVMSIPSIYSITFDLIDDCPSRHQPSGSQKRVRRVMTTQPAIIVRSGSKAPRTEALSSQYSEGKGRAPSSLRSLLSNSSRRLFPEFGYLQIATQRVPLPEVISPGTVRRGRGPARNSSVLLAYDRRKLFPSAFGRCDRSISTEASIPLKRRNCELARPPRPNRLENEVSFA
jgi:hypothetical protein